MSSRSMRYDVVNKLRQSQRFNTTDQTDTKHDSLVDALLGVKKKRKPKERSERGTFGPASEVRRIDPKEWNHER